MHYYHDLITIFDHCFALEYNTRLLKGGDEPVYLPADAKGSYNALYFAHGFFSSALHECAHWLIAGAKRRELEDFGYWYAPDGRSAVEQELFERVEVKPQALEWILSKAAHHRFRLSADNLSGAAVDPEPFQRAVYAQVQEYCELGLPKRAERFRRALSDFYKGPSDLLVEDFSYEELCFW